MLGNYFKDKSNDKHENDKVIDQYSLNPKS